MAYKTAAQEAAERATWPSAGNTRGNLELPLEGADQPEWKDTGKPGTVDTQEPKAGSNAEKIKQEYEGRNARRPQPKGNAIPGGPQENLPLDYDSKANERKMPVDRRSEAEQRENPSRDKDAPKKREPRGTASRNRRAKAKAKALGLKVEKGANITPDAAPTTRLGKAGKWIKNNAGKMVLAPLTAKAGGKFANVITGEEEGKGGYSEEAGQMLGGLAPWAVPAAINAIGGPGTTAALMKLAGPAVVGGTVAALYQDASNTEFNPRNDPESFSKQSSTMTGADKKGMAVPKDNQTPFGQTGPAQPYVDEKTGKVTTLNTPDTKAGPVRPPMIQQTQQRYAPTDMAPKDSAIPQPEGREQTTPSGGATQDQPPQQAAAPQETPITWSRAEDGSILLSNNPDVARVPERPHVVSNVEGSDKKYYIEPNGIGGDPNYRGIFKPGAVPPQPGGLQIEMRNTPGGGMPAGRNNALTNQRAFNAQKFPGGVEQNGVFYTDANPKDYYSGPLKIGNKTFSDNAAAYINQTGGLDGTGGGGGKLASLVAARLQGLQDMNSSNRIKLATQKYNYGQMGFRKNLENSVLQSKANYWNQAAAAAQNKSASSAEKATSKGYAQFKSTVENDYPELFNDKMTPEQREDVKFQLYIQSLNRVNSANAATSQPAPTNPDDPDYE